jgi:hypothetical protein
LIGQPGENVASWLGLICPPFWMLQRPFQQVSLELDVFRNSKVCTNNSSKMQTQQKLQILQSNVSRAVVARHRRGISDDGPPACIVGFGIDFQQEEANQKNL